MNDKSNKDGNSANISGRRKLLVGGGVIGATRVLPATWTGAVVNSVVMPAHAQTSITNVTYAATGPIPVIT
ncbi:MAG: hypothetical protein AAF197_01215 [Pseudomonadota bacterium]